jgi:RND family efflux transporter MFP subunit
MLQHRYFRAALFTFLGLLAISPCGCQTKSNDAKSGDGKGVDTAIKVGKPETKTLRRTIEQPATIEAFEETPLVAHISGYVDRVNADIGKQVKRGDILAELAVPEMVKELAQKTALVTQSRAEVDQTTASLEAAEAHILTAKAMVREAEATRARADANYDRWKSEYKRVEALVASKVVDRQILDETLNQFKSAEANKVEIEAKVQSAQALAQESEAKRNKAKADVAAARARVQVAQAEEGRMQALVNYREIRAPFDGVVTKRNVHTGHFLQPNASGSTGILFHVARTDILRIHADIPEAEAIYLAEGLPAKIQAPIFKDAPLDGKVARTSWTLDAKSRTLRIEIDHPNKEGKLRPGMYVNVVFTIELKDRPTLPMSAIFSHGDLPCCYRVESGKALRTPLKLGEREGQTVEILKMQKTAGTWENPTGQEVIVLTNLGAVTDGKELPASKK